MPKKEHERLWAGLRDMTHRVILTSPLSSQENVDFESDEEGSVSENSTCIILLYMQIILTNTVPSIMKVNMIFA